MQGEFETKICNRWLHSASRAFPIEWWDRCKDESLKLESFELEKCCIGVDLAERDDIAAVALTFYKDDLIYAFVKGFLPKDVIADRVRAVPEYRAWLESGELEETYGEMTDYARIEDYIRECCKRFDVQGVVIERYGALHLVANLSNDGLPAVIESKNAKVFTPPYKELVARLKTKRFRHAGSSFLRWQASNVCVDKRRDGSFLPTKDGTDSPNKIDAMDAIFLALSLQLRQPTNASREPQMFIFGASR
jgi:phage terminase large subunit-like protein